MKNKRFLVWISAFLLICCIFGGSGTAQARAATPSSAECVVEVSSRRILHKRSDDKRLPMASTTKILTAIIILDDCDLEEQVTIPRAAEGTEGSSVYLKAGETYTVEELLYGLMLRSGNDCAVTLALHHSGTVEKFAQAMNEKAQYLGATESNFVNPHGLPDNRHFTTARDLAFISAYAMENPKFREIVSCKYYEPRGWKNKNKMLFEYEGAVGVKTGFTIIAGRCLVTAAERDGMTLVCVVLNSPQMYERTAELLNNAFQGYSVKELCSPKTGIEGYAIRYAFFYPLKEEELEKIRIETELIDPIPQQAGDFAGQMRIFLENDLIFSQNLYIMGK